MNNIKLRNCHINTTQVTSWTDHINQWWDHSMRLMGSSVQAAEVLRVLSDWLLIHRYTPQRAPLPVWTPVIDYDSQMRVCCRWSQLVTKHLILVFLGTTCFGYSEHRVQSNIRYFCTVLDLCLIVCVGNYWIPNYLRRYYICVIWWHVRWFFQSRTSSLATKWEQRSQIYSIMHSGCGPTDKMVSLYIVFQSFHMWIVGDLWHLEATV